MSAVSAITPGTPLTNGTIPREPSAEMLEGTMLVLVPDASTRDRVRLVALSRYEHGRSVVVHVINDRIDACVREMRRSHGEGPLGVLAADEPSALDALQAGADEAIAFEPRDVDEAVVLRLFDRARLKAEVRQQHGQRLASLAQLEKFSALGTLVSGVAHEINNPLTGALLSLEMLKSELEPLYSGAARLRELAAQGRAASAEEVSSLAQRMRSGSNHPTLAREIIAEVSQACESIAEIVKDLGMYARGDDEDSRELVDLAGAFDKILRLLSREIAPNALLELDYGVELPPVLASRARLTQVLTTLLSNAFQALRAIEREVHRVRIVLRADEEVVTISVSDTGPGIPADIVERIFDPFFTTARDPAGAGLGLAVSRSIMRSLGGDLMVESVHGDGATFVAWLPRPLKRQLLSAAPMTSEAPAADARWSVLVVEPDSQVLGALSRLLRERYDVLLAMDGEEALQLIASGSKPDVVLADVDARNDNGERFVDWVIHERPDLASRMLLTTSRLEVSSVLASMPRLEKPLDPARLFQAIEDRLAAVQRKQRTSLEPKPLLRC